MRTKDTKTIDLSAHGKIGEAIAEAKRTLFAAHKRGVPLDEALRKFGAQIDFMIERTTGRKLGSVSPKLDEQKGNASEGVLSDEDRDRVENEVVSILRFFESETPDFISAEVIDAIDRACEHFEVKKPEYELGDEGEKQTRLALIRLFSKTRFFKLDDIETPVSDLAWAISTIITSPITPARLRQIVADFKTDITEPTDLPEEIENALQAGRCGYACCPGSDDPLNPCPGPDASGAHAGEREPDKPDDDDHVTVTLPNGEEVDLYGDAVDMVKETTAPTGKGLQKSVKAQHTVNEKVLRAMSELLNNPETPQNLHEAVSGFVSEQLNEIPNLYNQEYVLNEVLKSVPPDETRGVVVAKVEAGSGGDWM